jgi:predicted permease
MRLTALLRNLFRRGRVDRELDEEVRAYAAMLADEHAARGMDAGEARRAALAQMGGVDALKAHVHDARAGASLEGMAQDVRFAIRMLRKSPGFTAVAVLTLALGIGATTAIFSVVDGVLVQPLPYPQAARVAFVWNHFSPQNIPHGHLSIADFLDWRAQNRAFEDPAIFGYAAFGLTGVDPPQQVRGAEVSASFFSILRVAPVAGRTFLTGDDSPSSPNLAVISESLWRTRFGGNGATIGQPIHLGNRQATIVGVMPQAFQFPGPGIDVWTNLKIQTPTRRGPFFYTGIARLKDGVSWRQAQDDTNRIAHGIEVTTNGLYKNASMPILPIREGLVGSVRVALMVMFGAVLAVLLIGALNIANLLLARGTTRQREIAVRLSLGARRGRIVTQLMTESLVLSAAGCAAGTAVAWWGIALLRQWNADSIPRMADVRMNMHVFAFTIVAGAAAAMLFGIAPAIQSSRGDLTAPLKDGGRGTAGGGPASRRLRAALVIVELALSVVLLVCGGLLLRSFARLESTPTGFHAPPDDVLTMLVAPPQTRFPDAASQTVFFERAVEKVRALPGVESVAFSDSLAPVNWSNDDTFHIIGRPWTQEAFPSSPIPVVSDDYFRVLDIPVLRGRAFDAHDTASTPLVAVVSETFARRYMPNDDPIGQQVAPSEPSLKNPPYRIIGVVADVKFAGLQSAPQPVWYSAVAQGPTVPMYLLVRSAHPIASLASEIEVTIRSIDKDVIFTHEATLAGAIDQSVARPRFRTAVIALFAALALLLAAIGAYGVMAYTVNQRSHEIGVRMALGAPPRQIARLVIGESARLALLGIAIGIPGSLAASRALASLLFATPPTDAVTYASVVIVLLAAVGWATIAPARRAVRVDPLVALRHE